MGREGGDGVRGVWQAEKCVRMRTRSVSSVPTVLATLNRVMASRDVAETQRPLLSLKWSSQQPPHNSRT